jgi:hypothetical protein
MTAQFALARRMVGAEFLELRKKRSVIIWSLLLSAGSVLLYFLWNQLHQPAGSAGAGGTPAFGRALEIIGIFMGPLAAIMIGAEAGAGDSASGVFRDLVVTGRSRLALFAARVPGALAVCLPMVTLAYGVLVACDFALAGSNPTPHLSALLEGYGWSLLVDGVICVVAVGTAAATQSRPATLTGLIGLELVASPLLLQTVSLGHAREALLDASVLKLAPALSRGAPVLAESLGITLLVVAAWVTVAAGLGAWRTIRSDA